MSELAAKQCIPCQGGVPPVKGDALTRLHTQLGGGWQVVEEHHLEKHYTFDDFRQALDFTTGKAIGTVLLGWLAMMLVAVFVGVFSFGLLSI